MQPIRSDLLSAQRAANANDDFSTRRWAVSYPALQLRMTPLGLQMLPLYGLEAINQMIIGTDYQTSQFHGERSSSPIELEDELMGLLTPTGVISAAGIAFSAGVIWWASRAGGLLASFALAMPAWRDLDPMTILARNPDERDDWGVEPEADREYARDEKAVIGMLEDMAERRS